MLSAVLAYVNKITHSPTQTLHCLIRLSDVTQFQFRCEQSTLISISLCVHNIDILPILLFPGHTK